MFLRITKNEFMNLVHEFLKSPQAEDWPGLTLTEEPFYDVREHTWMHPAVEDGGPVLLYLYKGSIYVMET